MRKEHNTRECSIEGCDELNYSSSTQCYAHLRQSSNMSNRHKTYGRQYPEIKNAKIVYEFYYDDGASAYVGETKNGAFRIWEHLTHKNKSFCKYLTKEERKAIFNYRELWSGDNDMKRKMMETHYIRTKQPEFNKQYKHG